MVVIYILSFPHFQRSLFEGPLARSMLVSYSAMGCRAHCASLRLCALKCWETKAKQRREEGAEALHEKQRMRDRSPPEIKTNAPQMCTILSPQLSDFFSSLFPCGAHSARNGQGQPSENASPGCAAFSGVRIFILWQCFCAPSVSACGRCWMLMDGVC